MLKKYKKHTTNIGINNVVHMLHIVSFCCLYTTFINLWYYMVGGYMKSIIFLMFLSTYAHAVDCNKHKIYCQIKKNSPHLSYKYTMNLSNIVYKAAKKHNIPANIYAAILRQESGYNLEAKGCHKGYSKRGSLTEYVETKICSDFGISQIYFKTAERYGFSIDKLTQDLEYSVNAGATVLSGFKKRYGKKDKMFWLRYNCGSRGTTKRDTCQIYKKLVSRYL